MTSPWHHMPGQHPAGLVYGTQPGTYIDVARHLLVTMTHRGQLGSWFTFQHCFHVYGFPQDADARHRAGVWQVGVVGRRQ